MDQVSIRLQYPPRWSIETELKKPNETSRLCPAVQIALFQVLYLGGARPSAVVGHLGGEIAAACTAGTICMEEAIIIVYCRGFIARDQVLMGSMAVIGLDSKTTSRFLKPGVVVACENSPSSTTISGDEDVLLSNLKEIIASSPASYAILQLLTRAFKLEWPLW